MSWSLRLATLDDIPALQALIALSVRTLQAATYTHSQREAAIGTVFSVDTQLIRDGCYYVAQAGAGLVACGGWSRRQTLYGGDHTAVRDDAFLDPARDPARIRAFFVHPDWARRGLGRALLSACEGAAQAAGFRTLELASTLAGIPLYETHGYVAVEEVAVPLVNGETLPVLRMRKQL